MSAPRVVFRIAKLKTFGNIGGAGAHNLRTRPTPNADPRKKNIVLVGPKTGEGVVDAVKQKLDGMTVRKNAVLAVEVVISASPEYFRPGDPDKAGHWEADKLSEWRKATESWISRRFPHAASVVLHLDEATPHYQVIDVPINDDTGRLDARSKYGGRAALAGWQTEAAKPVAHLGIERGIEGSQAKHTTLKEFYGHVNKEPAPLPPVKTRKPEPLPAPSLAERMPFTDANKARAQQEAQQAKLEAKRTKEIEARKSAALKNYPVLDAKARATMLAEKKVEITEANFDMMQEKIKAKDAQIAAAKTEANKLRALPIGEVLTRLYGAELAHDSKEHHTTKKWKLADGQEVAVSPGKTADEVWIVQGQGTGSKGAINLVMALDGIDYKDALKVLGDAFGSTAVVREHRRELVARAQKQVKEVLAEPRTAPPRDESRWSKVKAWLKDVRAVPAKLVDWLHAQKSVYADSRNNSVFPRANGGAFVRGTTATAFHRTVGGKECGPYVIPGSDAQVVLCEAPVDALSLKAIYPKAKILALGGNLLSPDEVKQHIKPGAAVLLGFDNDEQGKVFESQAKALWPHAETLQVPSGAKDWNEALQTGKITPDASWRDSGGSAGSAAPVAAPAPQTSRFSFTRPRG